MARIEFFLSQISFRKDKHCPWVQLHINTTIFLRFSLTEVLTVGKGSGLESFIEKDFSYPVTVPGYFILNHAASIPGKVKAEIFIANAWSGSRCD